MPGIAGILYKSKVPLSQAQHVSMIECMHHEPFYRTGVFSEDRANLGVGWVVHRNSFSDCMPAVNDRRDLVLIFYGENFPKDPGNGFHNARQLLQLYEKLGEPFLLELNGWFTGLLVDLNQGKVILFNDRYGMQRLYYHETAEAFFFASEAKSLLRVAPSTRKIDTDSLAEYVAFDCVLGNKSLFEGISVMPGGSCWTFDGTGRCKKTQYYTAETSESRPVIYKGDAASHLECLLRDMLPAYFQSAEPVALSLTGGLDTRLIVAGAPDIGGLSAYTFAGQRDTFDVRQSRKVARAAGLKHAVLRLGTDFFEKFPKLAEETVYVSDGTLGVSGTHNVYFNRLAREIAPVRLTGLFGSEVLRQGRILSRAPRVDELLSPDLLHRQEEAEQRVVAYRGGSPLTAALHRDIPWRAHGTVSIEQSQVTLRSPFMDNALVELLYSMPNAIRQSKRLQQEVIHRLNASLASILSDHGDATGRNPIVIASAHMLLWVLFKADYTYFFEPPAWLLRGESTIGFRTLYRGLFGHQKFEHYGMWFRDTLPDYVADILTSQKTLERPMFNRKFLRKAVTEHIAGKADYRNQIDKALTLELITRTLIEGTTACPASADLPEATSVGRG